MSDTKFTPGNWQFRIEQIVPTSRETCFTVATDEFDVVSAMLGIRSEHDAHLIAAAPAMFELFIDLLDNYECGPEVDRKIDAIVAKARGEKS